MLDSVYDLKQNVQILNRKVKMFFPKQKIVVEFGEYDNTQPRTVEFEKAGIKIFNIPNNENIFTTVNRLLTVLNANPSD